MKENVWRFYRFNNKILKNQLDQSFGCQILVYVKSFYRSWRGTRESAAKKCVQRGNVSRYFAKYVAFLRYLKRHCSKSFLFKKWELLHIIKRCPKPYSTIPLSAKIGLISFDSVSLATLRFEIMWHQKRMTLQNFGQNIEHHVAYSARNFATSSFSDVMKFRNAGLPMVRSQTEYVYFRG